MSIFQKDKEAQRQLDAYRRHAKIIPKDDKLEIKPIKWEPDSGWLERALRPPPEDMARMVAEFKKKLVEAATYGTSQMRFDGWTAAESATNAERTMAEIDARIRERMSELRMMQSITETEYNASNMRWEVRRRLDEKAANEFWREIKKIFFEELHKAGFRLVAQEPDDYMLEVGETALNDFHEDGGVDLKAALRHVWKAMNGAFRWRRSERA